MEKTTRAKRPNKDVPLNVDDVYDFSDTDIPKIKITNPTLKVNKTKITIASIEDEDSIDLEFQLDKRGFLECVVSGDHEMECEEEVECDLGHKHRKIRAVKWTYESFKLTRHEALQLAQWLFEKVKER